MKDSDRKSGRHGLAARMATLVAACVAPLQRLRQATTVVQVAAAPDGAAPAAAALADQAGDAARRGGEVVQQVVTHIEGIALASQQIADVIGVVDGVAFQSNMLALNAAIQAARAGDQGPGFAVVATEAKALSNRAAAAAAEIKSSIGSSVQSVESGARLVAMASQRMGDIVTSIHRVNGMVSRLVGSTAGADAAAPVSLEQVDTAVGELDRLADEYAVLVDQSATAAQAMQEQAQRLAEAVASYQHIDTHPLSAAVEAEAAIVRVAKSTPG